ncbi:hypothetical protein WDW86_05535, partial [Bdellovibrionota bacterium FG-2]
MIEGVIKRVEELINGLGIDVFRLTLMPDPEISSLNWSAQKIKLAVWFSVGDAAQPFLLLIDAAAFYPIINPLLGNFDVLDDEAGSCPKTFTKTEKALFYWIVKCIAQSCSELVAYDIVASVRIGIVSGDSELPRGFVPGSYAWYRGSIDRGILGRSGNQIHSDYLLSPFQLAIP